MVRGRVVIADEQEIETGRELRTCKVFGWGDTLGLVGMMVQVG